MTESRGQAASGFLLLLGMMQPQLERWTVMQP